MALGDLMPSRLSGSSASVSNHLDGLSGEEDRTGDAASQRTEPEVAAPAGANLGVRASRAADTGMAYLPHTVVLSDFRHEGFEDCAAVGPSDNGLVSKWRPKDRVIYCYILVAISASTCIGVLEKKNEMTLKVQWRKEEEEKGGERKRKDEEELVEEVEEEEGRRERKKRGQRLKTEEDEGEEVMEEDEGGGDEKWPTR
ncbi:hypothetical protein GW17_00018433 [Ensete ventricosum]|nr:hypothetical protein GW17_00018433 [Ensete ventricosum]